MIYNMLTIAGSDSGGGAGIQADLKTFSALGGYGLSVITALTAQNTLGVQAVYPVSAEFVLAQLESVVSDIRIDSVKLGMLANEQIITAVANFIQTHSLPFIVLDTVMIAKGGHPLLEANAQDALRQQLLPLVDLITPNLPEAAALLQCHEANSEQEVYRQGKALLQLGCPAVLIKGGHLANSETSNDWLFTEFQEQAFTLPRLHTKNTHGTGCTLSAAIAALQPRLGMVEAVRSAKEYLQGALAAASQLSVGQGIGPVQHFYHLWDHNTSEE